MTYATELAKLSRTPQTIVVLTMDYCSRTFGTSPCLATGTKCYNTRATCKYTSAYDKTTKEYKFSLNGRPLPIPGENIRPYLEKEPDYLSTEIDPKKSLTTNARVTLQLIDELDNDIGIDPYVNDIVSVCDDIQECATTGFVRCDNEFEDPATGFVGFNDYISSSLVRSVQGTFWRKWIARNPYYISRSVTIKKGFHGMIEADYQSSKFIVDQIDGPDKGIIKIILKDMLKKADKVEVPAATEGKVTDDPLSSSATTINCDDTTDYDSAGYVRIDDEIIQYTAKTSTSFTGCTRASFGTTAAEHSKDNKIQLCYVQSNINAVDILLDILENEIGISTSDIDVAGFNAEKTLWLGIFNFTGIISKPMKASEVIAELCEQTLSNVFWSEEEQLIKLKVFAPVVPSANQRTLTDAENLIEIKLDNNEETRISRCVVYYGKAAIKDDKKPESYSNIYISWDVDAEDSDQYGESAVKTIYSRWIPTSGMAIAKGVAEKTLKRFRNPARKVDVMVELKDSDLKTSEIVNIESNKIQDIDGIAKLQSYQITKKQQKSTGKFNYILLDTAWDRKYGFIAPSGYPDYPSATDAQRRYAFAGDSNNKVNNGTEDGYYIY